AAAAHDRAGRRRLQADVRRRRQPRSRLDCLEIRGSSPKPVSATLQDRKQLGNNIFRLLAKPLRVRQGASAPIDHAVRDVVPEPMELREARKPSPDLSINTTSPGRAQIGRGSSRNELVVEPRQFVLKSGMI